jgi:Holliday junction resolvase RusA-like endonuclease
MTITITIPGTPVGKGRPRAAKRGQHITMYTDAKTASYENLVKLAAAQAMAGRPPIEGAVEVELFVYLTPPESWSNRKKAQAMTGEIRPTAGRGADLDNYAKSVFDGCNGICWVDDKQITDARLVKRYAAQASSVLVVKEAAA